MSGHKRTGSDTECEPAARGGHWFPMLDEKDDRSTLGRRRPPEVRVSPAVTPREPDRPAPGLRHVMRGREYFTLAFGSIVGVGWMVQMGDWLREGGPVGAMLAYLVCGVALVP